MIGLGFNLSYGGSLLSEWSLGEGGLGDPGKRRGGSRHSLGLGSAAYLEFIPSLGGSQKAYREPQEGF